MEAIFFVALIVVAVGSVAWHYSRSGDVLQQWADGNGYSLIEAKYAHFSKGPFFWTSSKGQSVYRVVVQDKAGRTRRGWVRCGSWMMGVWSDQAEVRWDSE